MLYLVAGLLKPGSEEQMIALHNEFNEHLSQPFRAISLAGLLRDREGKRKGYVAIVEAESFEDAEAYLHQSPFYTYGLYQQTEVALFESEIGKIE
jgi:uncharacterized protein YciI